MTKKILLIGIILMLMAISLFAQRTINLDTLNKKAPKDTISLKSKSIETLDVAIYKSVPYHVYKTDKGKYFIIVKSKTGTYYRKYITMD